MQFLDTLKRVGSERQLGQLSSSPQIGAFHWLRNNNDCWNRKKYRHREGEEKRVRKLNENFDSDEPGGNGGPGEACNFRPLPPEEALLGRTAAMLGLVRLRWHGHRSSSNGATHHDRPCRRHLVNDKFTAESTSKLGNKAKRSTQRRPKYELQPVYAWDNGKLRVQFEEMGGPALRRDTRRMEWGVWECGRATHGSSERGQRRG